MRQLWRETWIVTYGPVLGDDLPKLLASIDDPNLEAMIPHKDDTMLLAERAGEIVGSIAFAARENFGIVWGMYVSFQHQWQGIGSKLLRAAVAAMPAIEFVQVMVLKSSKHAVASYKANGFRRRADQPEDVPYQIVPGRELAAILMVNLAANLR